MNPPDNISCRASRLPQWLALAGAAVFMLAALGPYPIVGETWGMVWFKIAAPFSEVLKPLFDFESYPLTYVLSTTFVAALFWATVVYVLSGLPGALPVPPKHSLQRTGRAFSSYPYSALVFALPVAELGGVWP